MMMLNRLGNIVLILEPEDLDRLKAGGAMVPDPNVAEALRESVTFAIIYSENVAAVRAGIEAGTMTWEQIGDAL